MDEKEKRFCLNCGKEITVKDKRQKFCSQSCAATYNNKRRKKKKIPVIVKETFTSASRLNSLSKEELEKYLIEDGLSFFYLAKQLHCCPKTIKKRAIAYGINLNKRPVKQYEDSKTYYCAECGKPIRKHQIFCSTDCCIKHKKKEKYAYYLSHQDEFCNKEIVYQWLKPIILNEQNGLCAICGCNTVHNNKELHFVLDHIDGNAKNNRRDNLRLVCPNCDSQLNTFKARNIGKSTRDYVPYSVKKKKNKSDSPSAPTGE